MIIRNMCSSISGKRKGDIAVIAEIDGERAGAAFIRCWNDSENIRGYLSGDIPVLVIGVVDGFRKQGVGSALIESLKIEAIKNEITKNQFVCHQDQCCLSSICQASLSKL